MEWKEYLDILHCAEKLKNQTRHCYTSAGRHESVAEHSWRLCMMAYFIRDRFPDADMDKVVVMCMLHDMGEAFTGDIPAFNKTSKHEKTEEELLRGWVSKLPQPFCDELGALFEEMKAQQTFEAKLYKALDKMEAVIAHNESDIRTWLPLEYELQYTYGTEEIAACNELSGLKAAVDEETTMKIRKSETLGYVKEKISHIDNKDMQVVRLVLGDCFTNCYIVYEKESKLAMIIDPADEADKIIAEVKKLGLRVRYIVVTHGHTDHILALQAVSHEFNAPIVVSKIDAARLADEDLINERPYVTKKYNKVYPDIEVAEGDVLRLGRLEFTVMILPGHTPGSMGLLTEEAVFVGDVMMKNGHGKTSLPGGNAQDMEKSLARLKSLNPEITVYPGHKDITKIGNENN
ncbi:MAG: HD domain-containing protein [Lachnospiraceae bacterium]